MQKEILKTLNQIEAQHNVKILYACESGSRAWGFPSPDSDYDVRYLYIRPVEAYLKLFPERDVIEGPIDEIKDFVGWYFQVCNQGVQLFKFGVSRKRSNS